MRYLIILFLIFLAKTAAYSQNVGITTINQEMDIAFYNVENLFDTIDDPAKSDNDFLPRSKKQWNTDRFNKKLENIATVIKAMNNGQGPDIIGLCEVENRAVLNELVRTPLLLPLNYAVVHYESPDERGIDVALLYKKNKIRLLFDTAFGVKLPDSTDATRDILFAGFLNHLDDSIGVFVNHFPSRSEGEARSMPKRIAAALALRQASFEMFANKNFKMQLLIGDFNDTPMDSSILHVLGACATDEKERQCGMYNISFLDAFHGAGSYCYKNKWQMLDQFIMTSYFYTSTPYNIMRTQVFNPEWLKQTEKKYIGQPHRTYAGNKYLGGYSDHFPIEITLYKNTR